MVHQEYYVSKLADTLYAFGYKPRFDTLEGAKFRVFPWESIFIENEEDRVKAMLCEEIFTAMVCHERKSAFRALLQAAATLERAKVMKFPLGSFIHDAFRAAQEIVETKCNIKD